MYDAFILENKKNSVEIGSMDLDLLNLVEECEPVTSIKQPAMKQWPDFKINLDMSHHWNLLPDHVAL